MQAVREEVRTAVGFDGETYSSELQFSRLQALNYFKGDMTRDMPSMPGRSSLVDTVVADQIRQVLPQITEIFLEEDVVYFPPLNAHDIDQAQVETDYLNYVCFKQNNAFLYLTTAFHDALLLKNGYLVWEWQEPPEPEQQTYEKMSGLDWLNAQLTVQQGQATLVSSEQNEDGTFNYTLADPQMEGRVVIKAWPAEDVAVSTDTIRLGDGTYVGFRSRVRRHQLIADGYDAELVADLPRYGAVPSLVSMARDQAGEYEESFYSSNVDGMDTVQVYYHYIRMADDEGKSQLYRVVSGGDTTDNEVCLKIEEVSAVPASSGTPFPMAHRHFGDGLADLLLENQRTKTSLLRAGMDSIYFSLMGRVEVAEEGISKHTIPDLIQNIPGGIVRTKTQGTVTPINQANMQSQAIFQALEYMATAAEQKTGVLRSTMGINADSLHETRGGMLSQMSMGQTRVRWIARTMAETMIRDMILGVHAMIREHATMAQIARLNGGFVQIDPTSWGARDECEVDVSAGGRELEIAGLQQVLEVMSKAVEAQGGPNGPLVQASGLVYAARALTKALARKDGDKLWPDPQQAQAMIQNAPPKPDPQAQALQAQIQQKQQELQLSAQKQQQDAALASAQQQHEQTMDAQRFGLEQQTAHAKALQDQRDAQNRIDLDRYKADTETQTKRWQIEQELRLKQAEIGSQVQLDAASIYSDHKLTERKQDLSHHIDQQKVDAVPLAEVGVGGNEGG